MTACLNIARNLKANLESKMKQLIIITMFMFMATSALAIFDETPNTMGVYFDLEANEFCTEDLVDGNTQFTFYLVITNPSFDTLHGFEAGYHFDGVAGVDAATLENGTAVDSGILGNHIVSFGTPTPTSAVTLLATLDATYFGFEYGPAVLKLHGTTPSSMDPEFPVAFLEGGDMMSEVDIEKT